MANINKIRISGSTFDIEDKNAPKVVELTQQEYDVLPASAKTSNTLFVITDAQPIDITQYWTSAQTQSAITEATSGKVSTSTYTAYTAATDTALAGKQTTLTAGTGIDITNDVISVIGMVATSAVTSAVTSGSTDVLTSGGAYEQLGGMKLVKLTESEYTALVTKNSNTLYVVIPDQTNP